MINEKQKICINCHKDIIIRNSAGDVLFPKSRKYHSNNRSQETRLFLALKIIHTLQFVT